MGSETAIWRRSSWRGLESANVLAVHLRWHGPARGRIWPGISERCDSDRTRLRLSSREEGPTRRQRRLGLPHAGCPPTGFSSRTGRTCSSSTSIATSRSEHPGHPGSPRRRAAPALNRGFTSNGRADTATIFDRHTLRTVGHVTTGNNPDTILSDPVSGRVFTMNSHSDDITAFTAADGSVAGTIALGGRPEFAVTDGTGRVYVNLEDGARSSRSTPARFGWSIAGRWRRAKSPRASPSMRRTAACSPAVTTGRWRWWTRAAVASWRRSPSARAWMRLGSMPGRA